MAGSCFKKLLRLVVCKTSFYLFSCMCKMHNQFLIGFFYNKTDSFSWNQISLPGTKYVGGGACFKQRFSGSSNLSLHSYVQVLPVLMLINCCIGGISFSSQKVDQTFRSICKEEKIVCIIMAQTNFLKGIQMIHISHNNAVNFRF